MSSGDVDKVKGRIKKAVGELVDDPALRREGQRDEAAGTVKKAVERGVDKARDVLDPARRRRR